ncbi:MAG: SpoIIIAC/SpoIIIAD family protein [Clostridia bacterium]
MSIYVCFFLAILSAIFSVLLKKTNPEISVCISICAVVCLFFFVAEYIENLISNILNLDILEPEIFSIPIKLLGLSILSKISSSICEDAGEKGLSSAIVTVTKFSSVAIAFPLFQTLIEQIEVVLSL